jgi:threonine dehydratase
VITLPDIHRAQARIAPFAEATPAISCGELNTATGARVMLKLENLQGSGSVKLRGALSAMTALAPEVLRRGVITAASGNHALAVAHAARLLDTSAVVVMRPDAPAHVVEGVRALGARVAHTGGHEGRTAVPAGGASARAGAGTVAVELARDVGPLDVIVVPVGTGTLAAGCAAAAPDARLVTVAPAGPGSVAGGLVGPGTRRRPGTITVEDGEIVAAMRLLYNRVGVRVEPAGACAVAALYAGRVPLSPGDRVGVVVSGGNVAHDRFCRLLDVNPVAIG